MRITEKRVSKESGKDFIDQLNDTLVKVLNDNGFHAKISSAGCGKESNGTDIGCVELQEFDKNIRIVHPKDSEKYRIIPNMDGIDFDLAGKGLKQFTRDAKDLANELKNQSRQNYEEEDEPMELKEDRSFDDIWNNGSYDFVDTVSKMFRKIGWQKTPDGTSKSRSSFIVTKPINDKEYLSIEVSKYDVHSKLGYNRPFFNVYLNTPINRYEKKSTEIEDYRTSDLIPEDIKIELEGLEDFLISHAIGKPSFGGKDHYSYDKFSKPVVSQPKNAKERYSTNKEGRDLLLKAGVPEEFFNDWWIECDIGRPVTDSECDDGICNYTWHQEIGFTFVSKADKDLWYSIGDEIELKGYTHYKFYPGKMYLSNGDPGYPDEWDEDDPELEDASYEPDVGDWGPNAKDDDEIVAVLKEYVGMYCEYVATDAENNPGDYFC